MPVASVILPTHRDPGTLSFAVNSVLRQNEVNIELLIVCDGADEATLATARRLQQHDSRIVIHDLPKGAGLGESNRDLVVRSASSPVIFYIDEDDLWFPNHVSKLLEALRNQSADVACSSVVSVTPRGNFELAPFDHSSGALRIQLTEAGYRSLFKVHMCHTKAAYETLEVGWGHRPDGQIVLHLLRELAAERYIWAAIPDVTALSIHGSPRRAAGMSDRARTREVGRYANRILSGNLTGFDVAQRASVIHYLFGVMYAVSPDNTSLDLYLRKLGSSYITASPLGLCSDSSGPDLSGSMCLTATQRRQAENVLRIYWGMRLSPLMTLKVLRSLRGFVVGPPTLSLRQAVRYFMQSIRSVEGISVCK